jgi:hypothetical protein
VQGLAVQRKEDGQGKILARLRIRAARMKIEKAT